VQAVGVDHVEVASVDGPRVVALAHVVAVEVRR
jgi:hypothetical protein